ncbi:right-handed parallel beta-helix repeat-containing protein [Pendulispora albinea]|uniref:Right-handed parallel beta-helix repeat-containing protein n=1 Tax=Pendulispora albinea TaxID=2741071 RepID=A0ABZ2LRU4_9BACT
MLVLASLGALTMAGAGCADDSNTHPWQPPKDVPSAVCEPAKSTDCNIVVSPRGYDAAIGAPDHPVRSLKRALELVRKGQTIVVKEGTYDSGADDFSEVTVPDGVTLRGIGNAVIGKASRTARLKFEGGGELRDLVLEGTSIFARTGTLRATNVKIAGSTGFQLEGNANAILRQVTIEDVTSTAVQLSMDAHLDMDGGAIRSKPWMSAVTERDCWKRGGGITLSNKATTTVSHISIHAPFALSAGDDSVAALTNAEVTQPSNLPKICSRGSAIVAAGKASLTVEDSTVSGAPMDGGWYEGVSASQSATLKLRRSKIRYASTCLRANEANVAIEDSVLETCERGASLSESEATIVGSTISTNEGSGILVYRGRSTSISGVTITVGQGSGIETAGDTSLKLRKSNITGSSSAVQVRDGRADLGTLNDPGLNRIVPLHIWSEREYSHVDAAGNTWRAGLQGADDRGAYPHVRLESDSTQRGDNFEIFGRGSIQF